MPGFNICGSGDGPAANIELRRKHRWVWQTLGNSGISFRRDQLLVLQSAQRPNFKLEEAEMHHNQEVAWFAGKQSWEPITLTWYDVENDPDVSDTIYQWFESVVIFETANVNPPQFYKGKGELAMLDGFGNANETWQVCNCWPKTGNWGDLNYTDNEIATIEVEMRYDRAYKTA